jgi:hypothetical protein
MGDARYKITVSRVDEKDPRLETFLEITARRVILKADGKLVIDGHDGGHSFAAGFWRGMVAHPITAGSPLMPDE